MAKESIPYGGILQLADAMTEHPVMDVALYDRMSSWGQAGGKGSPKLERRAGTTYLDAKKVVGKRLLQRFPFHGVELGQVLPTENNPRHCLVEAAEFAQRNNCILVAPDLSRFIRAEQYNRRLYPDMWPTPEEFEWLRELTLWVPLATILAPSMDESERHSERVLRADRVGRPSSITREDAWKIVHTLGDWGIEPVGRTAGWECSIQNVAVRFGKSKSAIERLLNRKVDGGQRLKNVMGRPPEGYAFGFMWTMNERTRTAVYDAIQQIYSGK